MSKSSQSATKFFFEVVFFGLGFVIALSILFGMVQYLRLKNEYVTFTALVQKPAFSIASPAMMLVGEVAVESGTPVKQGQSLAVLQALGEDDISAISSGSGVFRRGENDRQLILTSPIDGVVSQVTVFAGSTAKPAQDMFFIAPYKETNLAIRFDFSRQHLADFSNWQIVDQITGIRYPIEIDGTKKAKNVQGEIGLAANFNSANDSAQFIDQEQVSVVALKKSSVPEWFSVPKLTGRK
jgi:hypothetical protein